jgi:hypothetical protein
MMSAFRERAKHERLQDQFLLTGKAQSSMEFEFVPLDPTALHLIPRRSPEGNPFIEYKMDILRLRF